LTPSPHAMLIRNHGRGEGMALKEASDKGMLKKGGLIG